MNKIVLNDLLRYQNTRLLNRYKKDFPNARLAPELALSEFLKYIWLAHQHQSDILAEPRNAALAFECVMHEEMQAIDEMWHTFLLFTQDYHVFCEKYLQGKFFHHHPADEEQTPPDEATYITTLEKYLNYIKKHLGEETLQRWFDIR